LAGLLPPRPRSVTLGMLAGLAMLTACGAVLAGASLVIHLHAYKSAVTALNPGIGGSLLLLLAGLVYLPNSVIWAVAYLLGPGSRSASAPRSRPPGLRLARCRPSRCSPPCR